MNCKEKGNNCKQIILPRDWETETKDMIPVIPCKVCQAHTDVTVHSPCPKVSPFITRTDFDNDSLQTLVVQDASSERRLHYWSTAVGLVDWLGGCNRLKAV